MLISIIFFLQQINSGFSLISLGTLIEGVPSATISNISTSELLIASKSTTFVTNILAAPSIVQQTYIDKVTFLLRDKHKSLVQVSGNKLNKSGNNYKNHFALALTDNKYVIDDTFIYLLLFFLDRSSPSTKVWMFYWWTSLINWQQKYPGYFWHSLRKLLTYRLSTKKLGNKSRWDAALFIDAGIVI